MAADLTEDAGHTLITDESILWNSSNENNTIGDDDDAAKTSSATMALSPRAGKMARILERTKIRSLDNRSFIRSHYVHLFWKSLIYALVLNILLWDSSTVRSRYAKRGRDAIKNTSIIYAFYIFAMIAPFVQMLLFISYLNLYANVPDPITLAKWVWLAAFESLVRTQPENRDVVIHSLDKSGQHLFYIIMNGPILSEFTKSFADVYKMVEYLLDVSGGLVYLHTFYTNHTDQARELLKRIAVYTIDVSFMTGNAADSITRTRRSIISREHNPTYVSTRHIDEHTQNGQEMGAMGILVPINTVPLPQNELIVDFRRLMALFRSSRKSGNFAQNDCLKYFQYILLTMRKVMPRQKIGLCSLFSLFTVID